MEVMLCFLNISVAVAQLTCPGDQSCSVPLCTNNVVQYQCNIYVPGTFTRWTVSVQSCGSNFLLLPQAAQTNCGSQSSQCGLFEASNVSPIGDSPCMTSILLVNIRPELNGSSIRCDSSNTTAQYFIGSATIFVLGELFQKCVGPLISITCTNSFVEES